MKRVATLMILITLSVFAFGQSKREYIERGDISFENEEYSAALGFYLKAIDEALQPEYTFPYEVKSYSPAIKKTKRKINSEPVSNTTSVESDTLEQYVVHQIATCYHLNHDYKNAETWYKKSAANQPEKYPYENYVYAEVLMNNEKYEDAKFQFEKVMKASEKNDSVMFKQAIRGIAGCYLALDTNSVKKDFSINQLDSVFNTGTSSFALNYYGDPDNIQFTSAREGNTMADPMQQDAQLSCDIYTLRKTEKGWASLKKIEIPVNTDMHEGAGVLSLDRSEYFFTRWSTKNKNDCAIYLSKQMNDNWMPAEKMNANVNLEGYKSMHPSLSADGNRLFFSSNRPGGFGKMDIWYVYLEEEGKPTGIPINMGALFNTCEDEVSPFFHNYTSTLYYSSNGLPGVGGLDVFKSSFRSDSIWTTPKNMGKPINSSKDDAYFVLERSQRHGYFSSDRDDCSHCSTGACYKIYSMDKEPNTFDLKGTVYNSENNKVIANSLITVKDIHGDKEPFYLITDSTGAYFTLLDEGLEIYVKSQKNKFFGDAGNFSTLGLTESQHFVRDFFLSPIPPGDIIIPGIEYDYDKATLRPVSKNILDDLFDFLILNNNLSVEISSHTDERGNDKYNLNLSQERAKSCVDYLIAKGITPDRLLPQGYGETNLLIEGAKTEEEHQKNRRTAFRPIKESAIKTVK